MEKKLQEVIVGVEKKDNYLEELGISESILVEAVKKGMERRREKVRGIHGISSKGYAFRDGFFEYLREELKPKGFSEELIDGVELTSNEDIAIYLCPGCKYTGSMRAMPSTRDPKGENTLKLFNLVGSYYLQDSLFENNDDNIAKMRGKSIWTLLFYIEENDFTSTVRAELSTPYSYDKQNRINSFSTRIILDTSESIINLVPDAEDAEFTEDVSFEIKSR